CERSVVTCCSCIINWVLAPLLPPDRLTCAKTGVLPSPTRTASVHKSDSLRTAEPSLSEARIEIQLPDVQTIARSVDLVGAQIPESHPGVLCDTKRAPDVVALGVGATFVEVRIRPGIQNGISLDVAVTDRRTPPREGIDERIAQTDLGDVTL